MASPGCGRHVLHRVADQVVVGQRPHLERRGLDAEERVERVDLVEQRDREGDRVVGGRRGRRAAEATAPGASRGERAAAAAATSRPAGTLSRRDPSRPPVARQEPLEHTEHGVVRPDPYHWMRDADSPELLAHLLAERRWYDSSVCPSALPVVAALRSEMVSRLPPVEQSATVAPYALFLLHPASSREVTTRNCCGKSACPDTRRTTNSEPDARGRRKSCSRARPRLRLAGDDSGYLDLGVTLVSPDENLLAYSVDTTGDEVFGSGSATCGPVTTWPRRSRAPTTAAPGAPTRRGSSTPCTTTPTGRSRSGGTGSAPRSATTCWCSTEPDERFELNLRGHPLRRPRRGAGARVEQHQRGLAARRHRRRPLPPRSVGGRRPGVRYHAEPRRLPDGSTDLLRGHQRRRRRVPADDRAPCPRRPTRTPPRWVEAAPERPHDRLAAR